MAWGWRLSSVTFRCCLKTIPHSVFTTWKWHPFATWTPSFIILVWGHHPPLRRTVFACFQNCYNSCISCSRSALRYDSINSNLMNYSWTNGRLAIPALAGLLVWTTRNRNSILTSAAYVWTERTTVKYSNLDFQSACVTVSSRLVTMSEWQTQQLMVITLESLSWSRSRDNVYWAEKLPTTFMLFIPAKLTSL